MNESIKQNFFKYIGSAASLAGYSRSYKIVLLKAILKHIDENGQAPMNRVVDEFIEFYKDRARQGLITDKNVVDCIENIYSCTFNQALRVIRINPYLHIHEAGFLFIKTTDGDDYFVIPKDLWESLSKDELTELDVILAKKLELYYSRIDEEQNSGETISNEIKELIENERIVLERGKYISVLKERFFVPDERDKYRILGYANVRGMKSSEYEIFLAGCRFSSEKAITDESIEAFFSAHVSDMGKVVIPVDPKNQWIYRFANENKISLTQLAAIYGFDYEEQEHTALVRVKSESGKSKPVQVQKAAMRKERMSSFKEVDINEFLNEVISLRLSLLDKIENFNDFMKLLNRLNNKATREFKKNKYISDIRIDDNEYALLKTYLYFAIQVVSATNIIPSYPLFATAVVTVAVKTYKGGNLWGKFFDEIELEKKQGYQTATGKAFLEILKSYDKLFVEGNQYYQNILLHCFISDYYAPEYFKFLYDFYRLDIDRDIDRLSGSDGKEIMDGLMDSIFSEEGGRTYHLRQHISQSMAANRSGSRTRVRNHLKKLDKFFWNYDYQINTTHRIYNHMQDWVRNNKEFSDIYKQRGMYGVKSAKSFSYPYVYYDEAHNCFEIKIPSQSVKAEGNDELYWFISGTEEKRFEAELTESVIGYKVSETKFIIPFENALKEYRISLVNKQGDTVKSFPIKSADVRFFDDAGNPINSMNIKTGDVTSISNVPIESSALIERRQEDGLYISFYQFEYEDIIKLPNGNAVIVGKEKIENDIIGKGLIEQARCVVGSEEYELYNIVPHLALRMAPDKAPGTVIELDGLRYHISECSITRQNLLGTSFEEILWKVLLTITLSMNRIRVLRSSIT